MHIDKYDFFAYHHERLTQIEWLKSPTGQAAVRAYLKARKDWEIQFDQEQQRTKELNEKLETIFRDTTVYERVKDRYTYRRTKLFQLPKRTTFAKKEEQCMSALMVDRETLEQYIWRCHEVFPHNTAAGACEQIFDQMEEFEAYSQTTAQISAFHFQQNGYRRLARSVAKRFQKRMQEMLIPVEIEYEPFHISIGYGCDGGMTGCERNFMTIHLGSCAHAAGAWLGTTYGNEGLLHASFGIRLTEGAFEKRYLTC